MLLAGVIIGISAAAGGVLWWTLDRTESPVTATTPTVITTPPQATVAPVSLGTPASKNLLPNPSFEGSTQSTGLADGLGTWGQVQPSLVPGPAVDGTTAQRLDMVAGGVGGIFFEVPTTGGVRYTQSVYLAIPSLMPGARVDVILEFYDASMGLRGYRILSVRSVTTTFVRRIQSATAPAGTQRLRFVVNIVGGGVAVIDGAQLEVGDRATPFSGGA